MNFSSTLKMLREANHITQAELGKFLEVSRATIAGYETKNRQPDYEKLIKLSQLFDVSVDYMLTTGEMTTVTQSALHSFSEKALDKSSLALYNKLSLHSKQDALAYLLLLEMRDKKNKKL